MYNSVKLYNYYGLKIPNMQETINVLTQLILIYN